MLCHLRDEMLSKGAHLAKVALIAVVSSRESDCGYTSYGGLYGSSPGARLNSTDAVVAPMLDP